MRVFVDGAWGLDIRRLCIRLGYSIPVNYIQMNWHFLDALVSPGIVYK